MSRQAVVDVIFDHVLRCWQEAGTPTATAPLVWDDDDEDKPGFTAAGAPIFFGRCTMVPTGATPFSHGASFGGKDSMTEVLTMQLFPEPGKRAKAETGALVEHVLNIFRRANLTSSAASGIFIGSPTPNYVTRPRGQTHEQINVVVPVTYLLRVSGKPTPP